MHDFKLGITEHRHRPLGATEVQTVLTVTAGDELSAGLGSSRLAEVIAVDTSGSMMVNAKMAEARRATVEAVEALPDGAMFAIVAGHHDARMVYPKMPELAAAGPATRRQAQAAARRMRAYGGTSIGEWLSLAQTLLAGRDEDIRHVTLLTDGQNGERPDVLARVLDECGRVFQCDARGIGDDWNALELVRIAAALRGQARAVTADSDLAAEFRAIVHAWTAKSVRGLTVRIQLSPFAELLHLRQVHPVKTDLTAFESRSSDGRRVDVDTGAWTAGEEREYSLVVSIGDAGELNEDLRAARIDVFTGDVQRARPAAVVVRRIRDDVESAPLDPKVRGYSGEEELSRVIGEGYEAYLSGRLDELEEFFARAVEIARTAKDQDMLARLARVMAIGADGRARLKPDVRPEDLLVIVTMSQISQFERNDRDDRDDRVTPPGPDRICPRCERVLRPQARYCPECRIEL